MSGGENGVQWPLPATVIETVSVSRAVQSLLEAAWDNGFTERGRQNLVQQRDPSHPITRTNPYSATDTKASAE